jgi:hypothetical protein
MRTRSRARRRNVSRRRDWARRGGRRRLWRHNEEMDTQSAAESTPRIPPRPCFGDGDARSEQLRAMGL